MQLLAEACFYAFVFLSAYPWVIALALLAVGGIGWGASHVLRARARRARLPDASDPRWNASNSPAQLVGRVCASCGVPLITAEEARACDACDGAVHGSCAARHAASHVAGPRPYRTL